MKAPALRVSRFARSAILKPLAILMAVLLVPTLSWFEGMAGMPLGSSARSFQASAQVVISGCNSPRGNKIIQKVCVDGNPYNVNGDLDQLESDAVNLYLKQHNLPASDTGLIYSEGREDLRNQIRGEMMNILTGIIAKPASQRTAHEQMLYNWLQALVQQDEIAEYGSALAEYQKWQNNPCNYTLDPTIAAQYGLSYNGPAMCEPQSAIAAGPPWVPAASYFTAVGLERSYGQAAQTTPNFASMVANTEIDAGTVWGTAVGVGAALGALSGLGVAATFTQLFPFAAAAAAPEIALGLAEAGLWATSGGILAGLGAGNIVFLNVVVGVVAAMQLASNQQQLNQLNNLQTLLTQAQNTPPDLNSFVNDTTGLGMLKLTEAFDSQTLPDVPSTAPLPAHNPDDPVFLITPAGGSATVENSFSYTDWNGISWKAETSGGWFDLTCLGDSSGKNCTQTDAFNASFQYVDWSGAQRTAWLYGSDTFAVTKNKPASTDTTCSNVTAATDLSTCSSYVANLIEYTYQGADYTLQLTNLPVFSGPTTFFFYWGGPRQDAMVTAGGTPAPTISLASGSSLPAGVYFNGGNGSAQFQFLGFDSGTRGTYQVTLQAKNANGIATQTFTIVIAAQLQITSPGSATFAYGLPASFLVTTTGAVTGLSISPGILFPGLTFHDNDNGTATISGTPTAAGKLPTICGVINGQPCPTLGITATDPFGSVTQPFSITVNPPPQPQFTVPGATFVAGEANSFTVTTTPTTAPVAFITNLPSWMSFQDNGNGTGILSGTPPAGTSGSFLTVPPYAVFQTTGSAVINPASNYFVINVIARPEYVSPNTTSFLAGGEDTFSISTNQTSGTITETGALPPGLTFTDNGDGSASISGTPALGSGGPYTVQLSIASPGGTATQNLNLLVKETPAFTTATTANFYVGQANSFAVEVSGYPLLSSAPVSQSQTATNYVAGVQFMVSGLPGDLSYSNLNPQGYNTGTLTISGTPSVADVGQHLVTIIANNGVGIPATQTLTLTIAAVPGDVNGDGSVTCTDFGLVRASFGKYRGEPGYNPAADLNNDGVVNIKDLAIVSRNVPQGTVCH